MPHRRRVQKGSFGGHLDEVVKHFPDEPRHRQPGQAHERPAELQEKIDIHARLFEQAWELDRTEMEGSGI